MDFFEAMNLLADRPTCEHNLNGDCGKCGPGLTLAEAVRWRAELDALGIAPDMARVDQEESWVPVPRDPSDPDYCPF